MAGTIVADDLKHSNNDTVGTEYIINGSAKVWCRYEQEGTHEINGSFNTSSLTDINLGRTSLAVTNNFDSANNNACSASAWDAAHFPATVMYNITTSGWIFGMQGNGTTEIDGNGVANIGHGDLA